MKFLFLLLSACLLYSCGGSFQREEHFVDQEENSEFNKFKKEFIDSLCLFNPLLGTNSARIHCDSLLSIPTVQNRKKQLAFSEHILDRLYSFSFDALSRVNQTAYYRIENSAKSSIFYTEKLKDWEWNPAFYSLYDDFSRVLLDSGLSLNKRMAAIDEKLENVPEYYVQAKMNLYRPTKEHTILAIDTLMASLSLFERTIPDSLKTAGSLDFSIDSFNQKLRSATQAIEDYLAWLKNDLLPNMDTNNSRDFRLGKEHYAKKFALQSQSIYKAKEVYAKAMEEKALVLDDMQELADSLWPKYFGILKKPTNQNLKLISMVLDTLCNENPDSVYRNFSISKMIEFAEGEDILPEDFFLLDRGEERDLNRNNSFSKVQAFIAEQTSHYYQRKSEDKPIFDQSPTTKSWAMYVMRMFLEKGYGGDNPEIWLLFYKEYLQLLNQIILEYSVHSLGLKKEEAMEMLVQESFLTEEEAEKKWDKIVLYPVENRTYFSSYDEIRSLRNDMRSRYGDDFELEDFHEYFLSFGDIPVKQIRIEMMK